MPLETNDEEFFGQVVENKPKNAGNELSITFPLFSLDKTASPAEYGKIMLEAEEMAQNYDLVQMVEQKKVHFTVLDQLYNEYTNHSRIAPNNIKEKVKDALLRLSR